jgi:cellobiose-specific phosphotransferase system component IIA
MINAQSSLDECIRAARSAQGRLSSAKGILKRRKNEFDAAKKRLALAEKTIKETQECYEKCLQQTSEARALVLLLM